MPDYQKMYLTLFNGVTDAIEKLQNAQRETEELYLQGEELLRLEPPIRPSDPDEE